eukprot:1143977-Pelagomonas_calceolata.AAC.2
MGWDETAIWQSSHANNAPPPFIQLAPAPTGWQLTGLELRHPMRNIAFCRNSPEQFGRGAKGQCPSKPSTSNWNRIFKIQAI